MGRIRRRVEGLGGNGLGREGGRAIRRVEGGVRGEAREWLGVEGCMKGKMRVWLLEWSSFTGRCKLLEFEGCYYSHQLS